MAILELVRAITLLTFPMTSSNRFADVFDDVIGNVRASGGIGDTADDL